MNYPYQLSLHRYKLTFQLPENMDNPNFFGSKLRGILGSVLKETNPEVLKHLYERQALPKNHPASVHIGVTHSPSPFIIPRIFPKESQPSHISFVLTLLGDYHQYFINIYQAFENLEILANESKAIKFIGMEKLNCLETGQLTHHYQDIVAFSENMDTTSITLHFKSPFILADKNKTPIADFSFQTIIKNLHRRLALLSTIFGQATTAIEEWNSENLNQQVQLSHIQLTPKKISREPSGKNSYSKNAFIGQLSYMGELGSYLPLLIIGQYIHIGSDTAFGLGKYKLKY